MDLPPTQIVCIAQVIQAEAKGESELGQRAVGHVILNRSRKLKVSPCTVTRQPNQFQVNKRINSASWRKAYQVAYNLGKDPTGGATYFVYKSVRITWRAKLTTVIGNHVFYK